MYDFICRCIHVYMYLSVCMYVFMYVSICIIKIYHLSKYVRYVMCELCSMIYVHKYLNNYIHTIIYKFNYIYSDWCINILACTTYIIQISQINPKIFAGPRREGVKHFKQKVIIFQKRPILVWENFKVNL